MTLISAIFEADYDLAPSFSDAMIFTFKIIYQGCSEAREKPRNNFITFAVNIMRIFQSVEIMISIKTKELIFDNL